MPDEKDKPKGEKELLTAKQVAEKLGLSVPMVYKLEENGKIQAVDVSTGARVQRELRFDPDSVDKYLSEAIATRKGKRKSSKPFA